MSALATEGPLEKASRFLEAPIGKKAVMAVTGAILFGFVLGHLVGNLQIFLGPEHLNQYAELLRSVPKALWAARIVLMIAVAMHVVTSVQLARIARKARPIGYAKTGYVQATYASRTMMWSGPIIAAFIVYHLLDFTFGTVNPNFQAHDVYANVIASFSVPWVAVSYMIAVSLLGVHLYHGLWSMFQSLGIAHPRYTPKFKTFAKVFAVGVTIGNVSIPLAVVTGLVRY